MADSTQADPTGRLEGLVREASERATLLRHDIHQHPELMFEEVRTAGVVSRELESLGIAHKSGLAKGTGVLGFLPATTGPVEDAKTIALRADMDALPIEEETGAPYASTTPGVMHACGHDGHTAGLLGVAHVLAKTPERPHNVLLVFQPAEEGGGGADHLCREGALDGSLIGRPVDVIYGAHGFPDLEVGRVSVRDDVMFASTDEFTLRIRGKGGHAAYPHQSIDPVVVGAHVITALQTVVSRRVGPVDSAVITVGSVHAGTTFNVIPDTCTMQGTLRALNTETRRFLEEEFRLIVNNTAAAFGASAEIEWIPGYPATVNEAEPTERFRRIARSAIGEELVMEKPTPTMGGEDFSYYGQRVPACFFLVGLRPKGWHTSPGLHTPRFDFNDEALPVSIGVMSGLALDAL
ncbi:MAG: M20 aminoacylase family protein [Phycisphaerales bacterium]